MIDAPLTRLLPRLHAPRPLPRLHTPQPLPRLQTPQPLPASRLHRPLPRLPRVHLPRFHLPRFHLPSRAVLVAWTCLPLFAAQLMLLSVLLTQ